MLFGQSWQYVADLAHDDVLYIAKVHQASKSWKFKWSGNYTTPLCPIAKKPEGHILGFCWVLFLLDGTRHFDYCPRSSSSLIDYSTLLNKRACTFSFSKGLWSALYALLDPTRLLKFTNFILLVNKNAIKCEFSCTFITICPWTFIFFQKGLTLDSY